ncbi:Actin [Trachipleistophora hominis]|uniref:Actin n=1 Tax=Trachipleistophora hominis TaxID=72359 RepID=L7JU00_TRAHO|nr:Actin [Trachipleistophora hominis]
MLLINNFRLPLHMIKNDIFIIDIGTSFYKMGHSLRDCSIFGKTPDDTLVDKEINDYETYLNLIESNLGTEYLIINLGANRRVLSNLFEKRLVQGIMFVDDRVMDLYAAGKNNGIIINVSGSGVECAAICDSLVVESVKIYDGKEIDAWILKDGEDKFVFKETFNYLEESKNTLEEKVKQKVLNDIEKAMNDLINKIKPEMKNSLLANIVLCGGYAKPPSLTEKIYDVLSKEHKNIKVTKELDIFSTYTGCDILSRLDDLDYFIGMKDYEEYGANVLDKFNIEWRK